MSTAGRRGGPRRGIALLLCISVLSGGLGTISGAGGQPVAALPPAPDAAVPETQNLSEATPLRVSYIHGEVSFWRPGADDWVPARVNTPLAPGDMLYAGPGGNVEVQVGPRAFLRATDGTQIGLDNHEAVFLQFRVTMGVAALDLRHFAPGSTIEVDTPNAALTIERGGFYRIQVDPSATVFTAHRGGSAAVTPAGATAAIITANQQATVSATDPDGVSLAPAPVLSAWDRWNYQRTDYLLQYGGTPYVSSAVLGTETLGQYGRWQTAEAYGPVWVPTAVPAGWVPYSTGRWIWDPRFGWTWLDDAPWGWAPYHYGRWVFVRNVWAWAPGPLVVRPVYAPALVVFLGGVAVGRPLCWAPLGWGEPVIPWWGRRGFVGVPWWGGWGGPRVVNNVVIDRHTTVNVTNITVYKNVNVTNAVVGVRADHFGRGPMAVTRIDHAEVRQLRPVAGPLEIKPVAASVVPGGGATVKPPATLPQRAVVATRPASDPGPALRAQGLRSDPSVASTSPSRLVPPPRPPRAQGDQPKSAPPAQPAAAPANRGQPRATPPPVPATAGPAPASPAATPGVPRIEAPQRPPATASPAPASPSPVATPPRTEAPQRRANRPDQDGRLAPHTPAPPPVSPQSPSPGPPAPGSPSPGVKGRPAAPSAGPEPRAPQAEPPARKAAPDRDDSAGRNQRTDRSDRGDRR